MTQRPAARPTTVNRGPAAAPRRDVAPRHEAVTRDLAPAIRAPESTGGAPDVKQVFDRHIGSADPRQRRIAARAFDACVPAFLPGQGESPSPEPLIHGLPLSDHRGEREVAYRELYARCASFLRESREWLMGLQGQLRVDPDSQEPGLRAQDQLIAGRYDQVDAVVSQVLAGDDPAGVASLAGLAARLALLRSAETPDPDRVQRARAVDAALTWVACDLGLDCGANSIGALQLCAVQGMCDGYLLSRLMDQAIADGLDYAEVKAQRARLLALVRSGRPAGAADLLPSTSR